MLVRQSQPNITKPVWAGRFQLVPIVLFAATLTLSLWRATQYVASHLGYQSQLGAPWFELFARRVYRPWQVIPWNYWYHYYAPGIFNHSMMMVAMGALLSTAVSVVYAVWVSRRVRVATSQGTARWMTLNEIEDSGLLGGHGPVLGLTQDGSYLQHDSGQHIMSVAPTGSGKGVGQIIPTLLSWPGSVVVHDVKGENWEVTAGYRSKFSNVLYFNPCSLESCHFNPLFEIRPGLFEVRDAQNIVAMLIDPLGKKNPEFWDREATTLLVACVLHVLYREADKSLAGLVYFLANPDRTATETVAMMRDQVYPNPATTRFINSSAQQAAQKYEKELSGVISAALSVLGLYRDPLVAQITSTSDFTISDLVEATHPVSLYMIIPSSDDTRITPLVRLMWSQIGRRLMEQHQSQSARAKSALNPRSRWAPFGARDAGPKATPPTRHPMLLMMDEFPTLGYMEVFVTAIAKIRSYGVRIFIITQSNNQIEDVYGPKHPFTSNCSVRVYYTPNDNPTAESISAALGTRTEVHQQKTYTGHRFVPMLLHMMVADQEAARALLTPGEVLTFGNDEAIIFVTGCHPIRARKLRYFEDENLRRRLLPEPPLTGEGPYPYRPQPRQNPWLKHQPGAMGATALAETPVRKHKNDERDLVRDAGEKQLDADLPGSAPDINTPARESPNDHFDAWHEATVRGMSSPEPNQAQEQGPEIARRAEWARQDVQRRRQALEKRHRTRDQDRDLGR